MKHVKHGEDEDMGPTCMSKLVCLKSEEERVLGFHFIGPNAGEVTQVTMMLQHCYECLKALQLRRIRLLSHLHEEPLSNPFYCEILTNKNKT